MTDETQDWSKYNGQKVVVTIKLDEPNEQGHTAVEIEGTVQAANALGIMLKEKGKTQVKLIEADAIIEVKEAPDTAKDLKAKPLRPVDFGQTRGHLLERHGATLTEVNSMTESEAYDAHNDTDHNADDLGHFHQAKEETPQGEAVAAAQGEGQVETEPAADETQTEAAVTA